MENTSALGVDFVAIFPAEICSMIFSYLPYASNDLLASAQTTTSWRAHVKALCTSNRYGIWDSRSPVQYDHSDRWKIFCREARRNRSPVWDHNILDKTTPGLSKARDVWAFLNQDNMSRVIVRRPRNQPHTTFILYLDTSKIGLHVQIVHSQPAPTSYQFWYVNLETVLRKDLKVPAMIDLSSMGLYIAKDETYANEQHTRIAFGFDFIEHSEESYGKQLASGCQCTEIPLLKKWLDSCTIYSDKTAAAFTFDILTEEVSWLWHEEYEAFQVPDVRKLVPPESWRERLTFPLSNPKYNVCPLWHYHSDHDLDYQPQHYSRWRAQLPFENGRYSMILKYCCQWQEGSRKYYMKLGISDCTFANRGMDTPWLYRTTIPMSHGDAFEFDLDIEFENGINYRDSSPEDTTVNGKTHTQSVVCCRVYFIANGTGSDSKHERYGWWSSRTQSPPPNFIVNSQTKTKRRSPIVWKADITLTTCTRPNSAADSGELSVSKTFNLIPISKEVYPPITLQNPPGFPAQDTPTTSYTHYLLASTRTLFVTRSLELSKDPDHPAQLQPAYWTNAIHFENLTSLDWNMTEGSWREVNLSESKDGGLCLHDYIYPEWKGGGLSLIPAYRYWNREISNEKRFVLLPVSVRAYFFIAEKFRIVYMTEECQYIRMDTGMASSPIPHFALKLVSVVDHMQKPYVLSSRLRVLVEEITDVGCAAAQDCIRYR
ncbi:hypothetical protein BJ508DRAFT_310654 [Ascobolus immersus RN42]|uniref:F-box domain-containing protein n=1 Tax=Ascobolus immersus RN42 TaxID=1160509 RepID=A0A3N4HV07_ASCIM|nr:hypothetical protein BJ508DRAFT_310654 [Ascobolus immersus RN42]